jgi:hypothetical protein
MGVRTQNTLSALLLAAASTTIGLITNILSAQAQDAAVVFRPREAVPEVVNRTFFSHAASLAGENDSIRAVQGLLGTFQFPENAILADSKSIHNLYRSLLERQVGDDPTIRTADLASPFNLSVQTLPSNRASRLNGGEFVFERTPETAAPAAIPVQPTTTEPEVQQPVQAKF